MYVCICNNVTESDIHQAVNDGAYSLDCLARELAVSTCCGQCRCFADDVLHDALRAAGAREQGRGAEHASVA
ncbi:MAG: (2Fe-2S)-binding protein [Gammaproteobacteria bacterium]|nr:(2Fe-2S)-binding protein [Gammaproteobacteria bacterium]